MKPRASILALLVLGGSAAIGESATVQAQCEWCGAEEAPADHPWNWSITIAGEDEPGERLILSGTVYEPDGKTPAAGVTLYLYHTNNDGIYPTRGDETGNARRHGYLRGWLRTDERGRYRVDTIRPRSYPSNTEPAHVHVTVKAPGRPEFWIDSFMFEDDPLLTPQRRSRLRNRGGTGVVAPERNPAGAWVATRDIVLVDP